MRGSAVFRTGVAPGGALAGPWVRNSLWTAARAVPSLDLRFADNKSLVDAVTGASLVTFTRASSGTFVGSDGLIKSAATNEPRFDHNPTTGESLGLLVEEARTNLCLQSEDFSTTWTKVAATVTTDAIVSPTGVLNADKLVETTANSSHYAVQSVSVTTTSRTASIYLKAGERTQTRIEHSGNTGAAGRRITINLSTGAITGATTIGTGGLNSFSESIVSVGNGWHRVISTIDPTVTLGNTQALVVQILDNTGSATYIGDGTSGIYPWGAQLEAGAFPTSYIPTTSATVTRAADVASITGSNFTSWYNQTEGTVFVDGSTPTFTGTTGFVAINAGGSTNRLDIRQNRTQPTVNGATTGVTWSIIVAPPTLVANTSYKQATAVSNASHGNSISGSLDTSSTTIGTIAATQLIFGMRDGQTAPTGGSSSTIKRLTYFSTRFGNEVLQRITQP